MRQARAGDRWRGVSKKPFTNALRSFEFENVTGLGKGQIAFGGSVTVICGGNGVGKSTLLNTILDFVQLTNTLATSTPTLRVKDATLSGSMTVEGIDIVVNWFSESMTSRPTAPTSIQVTMLDPGKFAVKLSDFLSKEQNFHELLDGLSPRNLDKEVETLCALVGKDYESSQVYEVEEYSGDYEEPFPYFIVNEHGVSYGSEKMGLGELSAHNLFWQIDRCPENSILLIEEPETYLSPRSQLALMNHIADASLRRNLWIILTTHSPTIVSHVPPDHIRLLARQSGGVSVISSATLDQLDRVLGVSHPIKGIIMVEDTAATIFLSTLLRRLAPDLSHQYEIVGVNSYSNIEKVLQVFGDIDLPVKLIGVYDGDRSNQLKELPRTQVCLPTEQPPELFLRSHARSRAAELADEMCLDETNVSLAMSTISGTDPHDWPFELAENLAMPYEQVLYHLCVVWLNAHQDSVAVQKLISDLRNAK